jgi:uncharacterized BrkB/YihY/UPF0761 family membrane protein
MAIIGLIIGTIITIIVIVVCSILIVYYVQPNMSMSFIPVAGRPRVRHNE